ncbi:MAG TPA: hypothetical protein VKN99_10105 [Polyangia bacterium]|nr:hypothetical protein [Polyangia bacterium]
MQRALAAGAFALALVCGCSSDPRLQGPFVDTFDRAELGPDYYNTGAPYRIEAGKLVFERAHNHPLWLRRRLPPDVQIEFDCSSKSPEGDLKVELFGDGQSYESAEAVEKDLIYTTTGYVAIFGGWRNSRSVLVRQDEHEWEHRPGTPLRPTPRVQPGRTYHWTLARRGGHLEWSIDGRPFLSYDDPAPLSGRGHDHFGFTGWETAVVFDNLKITPL